MTDIQVLRQEAAARRTLSAESQFGEIPSSIPYLDGLLKQSSSLDEKHLLFSLILGECIRAENRQAEVHYLRRQLEDLPRQPILLANLATALASVPGSEQEALMRCTEAVDLAQQEDRQVRYCLTCQVRVALVLDDYVALNRAIRGLIADSGNQRSEDTEYEFDFVDQIDVGRCDPKLLAQYKELV